MKPTDRQMRTVATLGVAAAGGALAAVLGLPVAWLLGATLAVAAAILCGLRAHLPNPLRDAAFFFLGVQAGSGVTPDVLNQLVLWPASFVIQMLGVGVVVAVTYGFLRHAFKWDRETALFASIPGALSFVVAAASDTRADMTKIVVVQSTRLLLLIGVLTPTLAWLESGSGATAIDRSPDGPLWQYAVLGGVCLVGAFLGIKSRLPGGLILGSLVASAILHGTEITTVGIPPFIVIPSLIALGALIAGRLSPDDRSALRQLAPASFGAFAIGLVISAAAGFVAVVMLGFGFGKVALAYAPGALEALTVLAFQFDQDPAYVAAHHVVRFLGLAIIVPVLAKRMPRRDLGTEIARDSEAPAAMKE